MKRVLLWAVILLLLAGAGVLIAISQIDTRFVADKISAALREATGAPLVFREAPRISLHPLGLSFGHVDWHQQQPGRDLHITAEGGHVRLDITPLLSGNLVVSEVTLRSPDIALRLQPDTPGTQTDAPTADSSLRQEAPAGKETSQTGESMFPVPSDELPLELQRLVVQDGRLSLDDGAGRHVEINGLQLVLTDIRSRADMGLDLALAYALRQQQNEASGKLSVRGLLRYYAPNILLRDLELAITPLTGPVPAALGPLSLRGGLALDLKDGRLKLQSTSLACAHSHMDLAGEISLHDLAFAGALNITTAPRAVAAILGARLKPSDQDSLNLSTGVEYSSRGLVLREFKGTLDKTSLAGSLDLRFGPRPALTGNLHLGHVNLDHWLPLPEAATRQPAPAAEADSPKAAPKPDTTDRRRNRQKAGRDVPPAAPNGYPDVNLQLQVESLRHASLKLTQISAHIQGEQGRYTASPVSLNLGSGGQVQGSAQTDLTAHSYALDVTATAVDLGGLSGMLDLGHPADGTADLRANLTTQGQDSKSLQAHVSGTGQLDIHQLRLAELAKITAEHPVLGKALPERFELVRLPLEAKQGEIISRPVTITSSKINGTGQATASLPRQYLHATADVHALGMTIPLIVKGPFSQISCSVDPRFLGNLTRGLTDALKQGGESGGRAAGSAAKAVEGAASGVGGLLRGVMGR